MGTALPLSLRYLQIGTQKYSEAWMNFLFNLSFLIYIKEAAELSELFQSFSVFFKESRPQT